MQVHASIGAGIEGRSQRAPGSHETASETPKAGLPALVPGSRRPAPEHNPLTRPLAAVIAQLAAGAGDHPFTRARRRTDPSEGANLYGHAIAVTAPIRKTTIRIL